MRSGIEKNYWQVKVTEDPETGDLILPIPEELMKLQKWDIGTKLEWVTLENNVFVLKKANE